MKFNKKIVASILDKVGRDDRYTKRSLAKLSFEQLYSQLIPEEAQVIKQLLRLKPTELGFMGPFITLDGPPRNLVGLENQALRRAGKSITISNQYLPRYPWRAFSQMQKAINDDIGSRLMVESGYRSPAHQAITFLTYLEKFSFDLKAVATGVALPGYSQHGDPINTAVDVINQNGIPTDEEPELFAETREYRWLLENAERFNFYLSYPKANKLGVKFEPWHWQFRGS
jgi:hypothetical protein